MNATAKRALMTHMTEKERRRKEEEEMYMRSAPYRSGGGYNDRAGMMNYGGMADTYGGEMRMGGVYSTYDNDMRNTYPSMGGYEPEMRRGRDSRGRYTSIRSEYEEPEMARRRRSDGTYMRMYDHDRMYDYDRPEMNYPSYREQRSEPRMNKIGFSIGGEMERLPEIRHDYPNDAEYMPVDEMQRKSGERMKGHAEGRGTAPMTKEKAMEWASMLENEDNTKGPHWTMEQVKQVMAQKQIQCDPVELFLALNLTYSDLCKQFRKHGINNMDAYVDFAKAFWLNDADVPDKLSRYYEMVVI